MAAGDGTKSWRLLTAIRLLGDAIRDARQSPSPASLPAMDLTIVRDKVDRAVKKMVPEGLAADCFHWPCLNFVP
jgi:hypothetical protein